MNSMIIKSSKKITSTISITINIFIVFVCFLTFPGTIYCQIETDTLVKDSSDNILRVKLNSKDSVSPFVPLSDVKPEDLKGMAESEKKVPGKAGLYSAILPGLGQAYNGNYWKIPIIYSLFAGIYFIAEDNNDKYQKFKEAYRIYDDGGKIPGINPNFEKSDLQQYKDYYKRNRDLDIILGVALYFMNILDASVDAHLMDYDIGEDLSLKISPDINSIYSFQNNNMNSGFGLKFVLSLH